MEQSQAARCPGPGKGLMVDARAKMPSCSGTLTVTEEKGSDTLGVTPAANQVYCLRNRNLRNMFKKENCSL